MTIALGLIWLGATRMPASAKSRYTTAGVLSAVFIGWEAVFFGLLVVLATVYLQTMRA
jgi:hypothetical protein